MSDAVEILAREITLAGNSYTIKPISIKQIPPFTRAIQEAGLTVLASIPEDQRTLEGFTLDKKSLIPLICDGGECIIEAVVIGSKLPADFVGELLPDDFLKLLIAVLEVNHDFFVHRLAQSLGETLGAATTMLTQWRTSSNG